MELDPAALDEASLYNFMMSTILPRPVAWISTIDALGRTNLAPYAYFMGVCCVPMTVLFCPVVPPPPLRKKDTLRNIEAVPEFVVNMASAACIEAVNLSAAPLPPGESEFDLTGVTPVPSSRVKPPRVKEAAVAFECRVRDIIEISAAPGGGWVVLGTVLAAHVEDTLLDPVTYQVDLKALRPVGRLGGGAFVNAASDTFTLTRYKTLADLVRRR
ncbi:flavin reductase family protein [Pandoraea nosoerga]|uniref:Flavin reductase family protein n=1 Tax=Pandoraea nosoerga TaxID=2508296 RepID=A0A5E4RQI2_9BURK|nr:MULTISPECIES: flavin reductase family protein [Pandoraea]MBN4664592.1 flavin reductase family protein [Pandoraea nosoerga]MBN4674373.1 flavin reductase family protein [Pandoraea nosoerga]MBN4679641.1 flavin reductase family protein [Pandoraea nosoerga]MBN4743270.1 flavin reductase family protein [Pandoraea nosoerga]VVD65597.1 flavin reductase family protein [Pandoraea nosoerga]